MTQQPDDRRPGYEEALKPFGYEWMLGVIGVAGPGNLVVVFAGPGDFFTACVTHDNVVLWCLSCGGTVDGYTDEAMKWLSAASDLSRHVE